MKEATEIETKHFFIMNFNNKNSLNWCICFTQKFTQLSMNLWVKLTVEKRFKLSLCTYP